MVLELPYLGPNEITVQLTASTPMTDIGFAVSTSSTAPENPSGAGYITREFAADTPRYVYLSMLYGIPSSTAAITADHFMKESQDYYLHLYKNGSPLCKQPFTTAAFTTLDTETRRENANPTGYYSWKHYFAGGTVSGVNGDDHTVSSDATDIPIEYKIGESIMIPMRVVVPRLSPDIAGDMPLFLSRIEAGEPLFLALFTYFSGTQPTTKQLGTNFKNNSKFFIIDENISGIGKEEYLNVLLYVPYDDIKSIESKKILFRFTTQFGKAAIKGEYISPNFMTVVDK